MKINQCKECGCTDNEACEGGCWWANKEMDVCSRCEHKVFKKAQRRRQKSLFKRIVKATMRAPRKGARGVNRKH